MFFRLAVSSSSKRARGASNFNSAILPAMSLIIEREGVPGATGELVGVVAAVSFRTFPRPRRRLSSSPFTRRDHANERRGRDDDDDAWSDGERAHTPFETRARNKPSTHNAVEPTEADSTRRGLCSSCLLFGGRGGGAGGGGSRWWKMTAGRHGNRWLSVLMSRIISTRPGTVKLQWPQFYELASMYSCSLSVALMLIRYLLLAMGVAALPAGPDLALWALNLIYFCTFRGK